MFTTTQSHYWQACPWNEAPAWARWAAMDRRGGWFWYEKAPRDEDGYFKSDAGRVAQFTHLPYPDYWRLSLHHRPALPAFFSFAELCNVTVSA